MVPYHIDRYTHPGISDGSRIQAVEDDFINRIREENRRLTEEKAGLVKMNQRFSEDNWDWRKKNESLREQLREMTEKYDNLVISSRVALEGKHTLKIQLSLIYLSSSYHIHRN